MRPLTGGAGDVASDDIPGDVVVEIRATMFPDSADDEDTSSIVIVTVYGVCNLLFRSQALNPLRADNLMIGGTGARYTNWTTNAAPAFSFSPLSLR